MQQQQPFYFIFFQFNKLCFSVSYRFEIYVFLISYSEREKDAQQSIREPANA